MAAEQAEWDKKRGNKEGPSKNPPDKTFDRDIVRYRRLGLDVENDGSFSFDGKITSEGVSNESFEMQYPHGKSTLRVIVSFSSDPLPLASEEKVKGKCKVEGATDSSDPVFSCQLISWDSEFKKSKVAQLAAQKKALEDKAKQDKQIELDKEAAAAQYAVDLKSGRREINSINDAVVKSKANPPAMPGRIAKAML